MNTTARNVDRKILGIYISWCGWAGLHEEITLYIDDKNVCYDYDNYCFMVDGEKVDDWKLSPKRYDEFLKRAAMVEKELERKHRESRRIVRAKP